MKGHSLSRPPSPSHGLHSDFVVLFPAGAPGRSSQNPVTPGPRRPAAAPGLTSLRSPGPCAPAAAPAPARRGGRAPPRVRPGEEPAAESGLGESRPGPRGQTGREAAPEAAQGPVGPVPAASPGPPLTSCPGAPSLFPGFPARSGQTALPAARPASTQSARALPPATGAGEGALGERPPSPGVGAPPGDPGVREQVPTGAPSAMERCSLRKRRVWAFTGGQGRH